MKSLKLHIGGKESHPDWKILDIEERPEVDFIANASCLEEFADNSVEAIYASHVLEHFYHSLNNELLDTLKEWHRVLQPQGQLYISVPDMQVLCWLYLHPNMDVTEKFEIMKIMFGAQINEYDIHKSGLDFEILALYLQEAGFQELMTVSEFGIFDDSSSYRIADILISLNVIATKS